MKVEAAGFKWMWAVMKNKKSTLLGFTAVVYLSVLFVVLYVYYFVYLYRKSAFVTWKHPCTGLVWRRPPLR